MTERSTYVERLARLASNEPLALCAGIDPSPAAIDLVGPAARPGGSTAWTRTTRAALVERFCGLLVEAVRDHAVAVKPQLAWFESHGASGIRALERCVDYARRAGLLVVLDGKRGDVPHTAAAYADAWLGDDASSGIGGDALTVNASLGQDCLLAMAEVAAQRRCALYALLHTSNTGAPALQGVRLEGGSPWWHALASELASVDSRVGPRVVGAVVGGTHPAVLREARALLPDAPLLVPGIGAQGGDPADLEGASHGHAPTTLVAIARSLLPVSAESSAAFRHHAQRAAAQASESLRVTCAGTTRPVG